MFSSRGADLDLRKLVQCVRTEMGAEIRWSRSYGTSHGSAIYLRTHFHQQARLPIFNEHSPNVETSGSKPTQADRDHTWQHQFSAGSSGVEAQGLFRRIRAR